MLHQTKERKESILKIQRECWRWHYISSFETHVESYFHRKFDAFSQKRATESYTCFTTNFIS